MMIVKILALSNSKIYFIYFTTSLYNTPKHPTSMILFFLTLLLNILSSFFLYYFLFSLSLSLPLAKAFTKMFLISQTHRQTHFSHTDPHLFALHAARPHPHTSQPRLYFCALLCALLCGKLLPLLLLSFFVFFNAILIFFFF